MTYSILLARPWRSALIVLGSAILFSGFIGIQNAQAADTVPPVVSTPSASGAVYVNAAETITADFTDAGENAGVVSCRLLVDDTAQGFATLSGSATTGTASIQYTFTAAGNFAVKMQCSDGGANVATSATTTLTAIVDAVSPSVSAITPTAAVRGQSTAFSVTYSDGGSGVDSCNLHIQQNDGSYNTYAMTETGGTASGVASHDYTYSTSMTASSSGQYATCTDASGNVGTGLVTAISLSNPTPADTVAPIVSSVSPTSATVNSSVNITANYSDATGVTLCNLYVDENLIGGMVLYGSTSGNATRSYTFSTTGTHTSEVRCSDAAGNTGSASISVSVSAAAYGPYVRNLIKLTCPTTGTVDVNHPCKAVYYVGSDGFRHAFPNEKVYFTWYSNFSNIIELNASTMASISLGKNVTYRPGVKMVKFMTLNRTYAVTRYGTLRWVTSESLATSLYGADWNRQIDDISDAFYTDYAFSADITSTSQYNPTTETSAVTIIDQNI